MVTPLTDRERERRRDAVVALRSAGYSATATCEALGINQRTYYKDLTARGVVRTSAGTAATRTDTPARIAWRDADRRPDLSSGPPPELECAPVRKLRPFLEAFDEDRYASTFAFTVADAQREGAGEWLERIGGELATVAAQVHQLRQVLSDEDYRTLCMTSGHDAERLRAASGLHSVG